VTQDESLSEILYALKHLRDPTQLNHPEATKRDGMEDDEVMTYSFGGGGL